MCKLITEISVREQVLSPYTALVGVADEASVVGVSQRVDVEGDRRRNIVEYNCVDGGPSTSSSNWQPSRSYYQAAPPAYEKITDEQEPSGEWCTKLMYSEHDGNLFKNIMATIQDETSQYTVYAVLLLIVECANTFDEWKLSAIKGMSFLKKSIADLESELYKILSLSRLEVDDEILSVLLE
jgi:hypothetical protein